MKKEILIIIIKVLIYALGLIAGYLGVSTLTSCSSSSGVHAYGVTKIITTDTTLVEHGQRINTKKYPYFKSY